MDARHSKLKIVSHRNVTGRYFHLVLEGGAVARAAKPGQFIMVKAGDCQTPLLRRPLGIHSVKNGDLAVLYETVGPATTILSRKKPGDYVDIIGPLGNGFPLETGRAILVAGGMGVAPLLFLAQRLEKCKVEVLLGARTQGQILCEQEFKKMGCAVRVATDDGSRGFKGPVTGLLARQVSAGAGRPAAVYACGPQAMLEAAAALARAHELTAFGSFEAHMACGIGACMGCVIKMRGQSPYRRVCKDGPVFPLDEVLF